MFTASNNLIYGSKSDEQMVFMFPLLLPGKGFRLTAKTGIPMTAIALHYLCCDSRQ